MENKQKSQNGAIPNPPRMVKYVEQQPCGVRSVELKRCAIGYVVQGVKFLYAGDSRQQLVRGDLFFLGVGIHYVEDFPAGDKPFEQVLFYFSPEELQQVLLQLTMNYNLRVTNNHLCPRCQHSSQLVMPAWPEVKSLFLGAREGLRTPAVELLKLTELVYHILAHEDCCLKSKLLASIDFDRDHFEQIIRKNLFTCCSIEELARESCRSLTSFKKEFRRIYRTPPHKWFISQRLQHARLQLISTDRSVAEIGISCAFPNTSHFIKLFKRAYGLTPAQYRFRMLDKRTRAVSDFAFETREQPL